MGKKQIQNFNTNNQEAKGSEIQPRQENKICIKTYNHGELIDKNVILFPFHKRSPFTKNVWFLDENKNTFYA